MSRNVKVSKKKYKVDWLRVGFICFMVYFAVTFTTQQLQINEYNVKLEDIQSQINEAKEKTAEIKNKKTKIDDTKYIEAVAREELGLVKPYEKIFIDVNK